MTIIIIIKQKLTATLHDTYNYTRFHDVYRVYPVGLPESINLSKIIDWLVINFNLDPHALNDKHMYTTCDGNYLNLLQIILEHTAHDNVSCSIADNVGYIVANHDAQNKNMRQYQDVYRVYKARG